MDLKIKIEPVESDCLAELKEENLIRFENFPDVCEPKLERDESTLLEDPLNVSSDAQGPFLYKNEIKTKIKSETEDANENCSEIFICPSIKTEHNVLAKYPVVTKVVNKRKRKDVNQKVNKKILKKNPLKLEPSDYVENEIKRKDGSCKYELKKEVGIERSKDKSNVSTEDEKIFHCPNCDNKYKHGSSLKNHIDSFHEGKKPVFQCDQCNKQYTHKTHLNRHIDSVHDGKKNECDQCNKQYSDKMCLK